MPGERVLLDSVIVIDHLTLATRNVKDFPPRRFGFVRVPYAV